LNNAESSDYFSNASLFLEGKCYGEIFSDRT